MNVETYLFLVNFSLWSVLIIYLLVKTPFMLMRYFYIKEVKNNPSISTNPFFTYVFKKINEIAREFDYTVLVNVKSIALGVADREEVIPFIISDNNLIPKVLVFLREPKNRYPYPVIVLDKKEKLKKIQEILKKIKTEENFTAMNF